MRPVVVTSEVVAWWAATLGVWLLTLSSVTRADLAVATPSALACALLATVARHAIGGDWRWPARTWRWLLTFPVSVVVDTVTVLAVPWQRLLRLRTDEGRLVRVAVESGADPRAASRRAAALAVVSATPGTLVLHDDDDTGELVVHVLVANRPSLLEAVSR